MGAGHDHALPHGGRGFGPAFAVGIALNLGFVIVEGGYGYWSGSMALVADAGHNLSDVLGLVVAWAGASMARRPSSQRFTFGLKKASILAALVNALFLLVAVGVILAESVRRLLDPQPTEGLTVAIVAGVGILINGATALMFARGRAHDINIRGAYLHMVADAAVSAAVVIGGLAILATGMAWIDPVIGILVAGVILFSTMALLRESVGMTLAGVPAGIQLAEIEQSLRAVDGVDDVHHLHVWSISTTEVALTVHLRAPGSRDSDRLLVDCSRMLKARFRIAHTTIQVEQGGDLDCEDC